MRRTFGRVAHTPSRPSLPSEAVPLTTPGLIGDHTTKLALVGKLSVTRSGSRRGVSGKSSRRKKIWCGEIAAAGPLPSPGVCTSTSPTYEITAVYTLPPYVTLEVVGEVTPGNTP